MLTWMAVTAIGTLVFLGLQKLLEKSADKEGTRQAFCIIHDKIKDHEPENIVEANLKEFIKKGTMVLCLTVAAKSAYEAPKFPKAKAEQVIIDILRTPTEENI